MFKLQCEMTDGVKIWIMNFRSFLSRMRCTSKAAAYQMKHGCACLSMKFV